MKSAHKYLRVVHDLARKTRPQEGSSYYSKQTLTNVIPAKFLAGIQVFGGSLLVDSGQNHAGMTIYDKRHLEFIDNRSSIS